MLEILTLLSFEGSLRTSYKISLALFLIASKFFYAQGPRSKELLKWCDWAIEVN